MKPQIYWDNDNSNILWMYFDKPFTMDEYIESVFSAIAEVRKADHHVDVIFYMDAPLPNANFIPALRRFLKEIRTLHHLGIVVSVYPNQNVFMAFAMLIFDSVLRLYNHELKVQFPFCRTVEEAYLLIKSSQKPADASK